MGKLIFITQQVDPGHPALAATVPKIRALAERVDEVVVLADRTVAGTLPDNCRSLSFGARTRAGRGARFATLLARELVLSGACDLIALKDTVAGTHARRWFNAALGTSTK